MRGAAQRVGVAIALQETASGRGGRGLIDVEVLPGPQVHNDAGLLEFAARHGGTVFHASGTCRMGSDDGSVVTPQLRVHGVRGLRVIDASVMPAMVSANTNAAAIMIGERGAALIKDEATTAAARH